MSNVLSIPPDLLPGAQRQVSARELRRHLERLELAQKAQGEAVTDVLLPAMQAMQRNQGTIREHIEALEDWRARGFWGRLAWLVRGR